MIKKIITHDDYDLPTLFECIEDYDHYVIVRLTGIDDYTVVPEHDRKIDIIKDKLNLTNRDIIADFKNVTKTDTSTIAAILLRIEELKVQGCQLFFINASERFKSLVEIQKVSHLIKFCETEDEAVQLLEGAGQRI